MQKSSNEITEFTIKDLNTKIIDLSSKPLNLGYVVLREIYKELGLDKFMNDKNKSFKSQV